MRYFTAFVLCALLLSLPAQAAKYALAPQQEVDVVDAWARATTPSMRSSVLYLTLVNRGKQKNSLIDVRSSAAKRVELHQTTHDAKGRMAMEPVAQMVIPAGGELKLEPGGLHVMLMDVTQQLQVGLEIPATLVFAEGPPLNIRVPIRRLGYTGGPVVPEHGHQRRSEAHRGQ